MAKRVVFQALRPEISANKNVHKMANRNVHFWKTSET